MPSAIDPTQIPGKDIEPDTIETEAGTVGGIATSVRDNGSDVHRTWQGMAGVYSAPESGTLLGLMQPVSAQATAVGDNLDVVSTALIQFAADVRPIKAELDSLRLQAEAFRAEIAGGVQVRELNPAWVSTQGYQGSWSAYGAYSSPSTGGSTATADIPQYETVTKEWHEDQGYVDRNNDLIAAVNAQQVALWEAERTCANKIRALYGAPALHAAQSEDDSLAYGLSEIPEGTEMPWGAPVERTEGCGEATATFIFKDFLWEGIAVGGVWGTVQGLGTLVLGYNPATGDWFSGDAYGAAWGNLGMLAAGLALNSGPMGVLFAADDAMQQFGGGGFLPDQASDFKDSADEALLNTGKALIAWDKWQDDPGTALGESVFNIGTALIPVGGAAVAGVKTASTAASVLTKMTRVVEFVDPAAWAVNGTLKLGSAGVGSLDNLIGKMDFATTNFDAPHIEVYSALDSPSALSALDDWGVDLNTVTARVDHGIPVLEFPGGRVELPAGAFDDLGGVRIGDDGASVPAVVHEPELVSAGGVHGETGPRPVNSIVDDSPVRTENGGSGESIVVNEPHEPTTGGGADGSGGSDGAGSDGSGSDNGTTNDAPDSSDGAGDAHPEPLSDEAFAALTPDEQYQQALDEVSADAHDFPDDADATAYGREEWSGVAASLDDDVSAATLDYTREVPGPSGITYKDINGALRAGPPYPADLATHIQRIDEAMAAHPLSEDVMITRGTDIGHWSVTAQDAPGTIFDEASYLSTSLGGPAPAFAGKDAILHLRVPEGTPAMWVEEVSDFGVAERELLLGRGLNWEATRSVFLGGQWHIFGKVQ